MNWFISETVPVRTVFISSIDFDPFPNSSMGANTWIDPGTLRKHSNVFPENKPPFSSEFPSLPRLMTPEGIHRNKLQTYKKCQLRTYKKKQP
jgi:hypothetical protein